MSSILTTGHASPIANDVTGIVKANISVIGSRYSFGIMEDVYAGDEHASELIHLKQKYVTVNSQSEAFEIMRNTQVGSALFTRRSALQSFQRTIAKEDGSITFDILKPCASAHHAVMVFRKGSVLLHPIDEIIMHLRESGILQHWSSFFFHMDDDASLFYNANRLAMIQVRMKLKDLFFFYGCCITVCFSVFIIELIIARL